MDPEEEFLPDARVTEPVVLEDAINLAFSIGLQICNYQAEKVNLI